MGGVQDDFSPGGALDQTLEGYEPRDQQIDMAVAVEHALLHGEKLLIEAGTGTGKTLAYLLPSVRSKRRVMISTATKTLQHQLMDKDIPLLEQIVGPLDAVLLKGRQNYLCPTHYLRFRDDPQFRSAEEEHLWPQLQQWAEHTLTGDRAELDTMREDLPLWQRVTSTADTCAGRECPDYEQCFLFGARERAATADIVVVNHHLFFADAAVQDRRNMQLLPEVDARIFDEGHHLEETASAFFTVRVSNRTFDRILDDIDAQFIADASILSAETGVVSTAELEDRLHFAQQSAKRFFQSLHDALDTVREKPLQTQRGTVRLRPSSLQEQAWSSDDEIRVEVDALLNTTHGDKKTITTLLEAAATLQEAAKSVRITLQKTLPEPSTRMRERLSTWCDDLHTIMRHKEDTHIYMAASRQGLVSLEAIPLDVRPIFWRHVFGHQGASVITSATLSTDGNMRYVRNRLGAPEDAIEHTLASPFDYFKQSLLYVPSAVPAPNEAGFVRGICEEIETLVRLTRGRAFVLFTSYRNMREAHQFLAKRLPYTVLMQGEMGRQRLLERFREDGHAVLFATSSFWEGVDVPGDALSLVIMDKLPFANPRDPLVSARCDAVERNGGNAFRDYSIPQTIIRLKQGFGRLIRAKSDIGIVAIMDKRIVHKSYGKRIIHSLPRARRSQDMTLVKRWWEHHTR